MRRYSTADKENDFEAKFCRIISWDDNYFFHRIFSYLLSTCHLTITALNGASRGFSTLLNIHNNILHLVSMAIINPNPSVT